LAYEGRLVMKDKSRITSIHFVKVQSTHYSQHQITKRKENRWRWHDRWIQLFIHNKNL